ncbi:ADP-heptose:LPS heptosyltransferase [Brevibacterium sanguinis]|uniref:ADP-heptose:LPS heptosyltransferase n=2 Tax=Brevibacterium TaxID=1696 RepID=A0A366IGQ6_9MICO|nr:MULTISPECIES: glycosyltransferase family 9 protein [Brevibacterium]RBP63678.1 ADP-heptose:LPS heptosyltransferase [Brevibacterium sanguinis]RBP70337.1 ADP-heptose:LPS heptosyltransferase [Brevibacterium celere]
MFIGTAGEKFSSIERIAVLRGGGLGDLMFAMPAIDALAAAYPGAAITLLGSPSHRALLADRPGPVDDVVVLPCSEGVRPGPEDPEALEEFRTTMRARRFDLGVQVHGGGRFSNPFLLGLGARHTVGTRTEDAAALERNLTYRYYQHEMLRALEVVGLAGAGARRLDPQLAVTAEERATALGLRDGQAPALLTIHPGATDPRRRWPVGRFADVAARAVAEGWQVLVVGDDEDAAAAVGIVEQAEGRAPGTGPAAISSLAGRLSLSELLGVLAVSDVVLGNDSGPRHLASAVGTATVGLFWVGNHINAGPFGRSRHRSHLSWVTRCPECGVDVTQVGWTADRCAHDPSFIADIGPDAVWDDVRSLVVGP